VQVWCDNEATVSINNAGTSITAKFEFYLFTSYVQGHRNIIANALSHNKLQLFCSGLYASYRNFRNSAGFSDNQETRLEVCHATTGPPIIGSPASVMAATGGPPRPLVALSARPSMVP